MTYIQLALIAGALTWLAAWFYYGIKLAALEGEIVLLQDIIREYAVNQEQENKHVHNY